MNILEQDKELIEYRIENEKTKKNIYSLLAKAFCIILFLFIILNYIFGVTPMNDISMNPKISYGDLVIYYRLSKTYDVEDVVTFKFDSKRYILRIVAKEGQIVDINDKGEMLVDNHTLEEEIYYKTYKIESSQIEFPYMVEKNKYFLLGDFRTESEDSRTFGTININQIEGKVIGILRNKSL